MLGLFLVMSMQKWNLHHMETLKPGNQFGEYIVPAFGLHGVGTIYTAPPYLKKICKEN